MMFLLHTKEGAKKISSEDIIYCQAVGKYTKVYLYKLDKSEEVFSIFPLSKIEEILPEEDFYRIHRGILIGLEHFTDYISAENKILLSCGLNVKISRGKKSEFKEKLLAYFSRQNEKNS